MFLTSRFYIVCIIIILLLGSGFAYISLFYIGQAALFLLALLAGFDSWLLWRQKNGVSASRNCPDRFSNGDDNPVKLYIDNKYPFQINLEIIDEIPAVFQKRDISFHLSLRPGEHKILVYQLHPVQRGEYQFGQIRLFVHTFIGLICKRITAGEELAIKVYPSYRMLHEYELRAIHDNLSELGIKKIRRMGHHTEFELIKEYVKGDDYRTINWKASARKHALMVNVYQDERSQQIYNVIDKGRMMQSAFCKMTLLDYAINTSLMLSYIALHKSDKAGLVTFEEQFGTFIPASRQPGQMQNIIEQLYRQDTTFGESDYSSLYIHLNKYISKRSLLIIYTNFDSEKGMERQINYLRQLSRKHVVLVVFFENTEIKEWMGTSPCTTENYFQLVIAEKFSYEKKLIANKLAQYGIHVILTTPPKLTVAVINKYLELKRQQKI